MTITNLSLPVDIPWKRIAFSKDMMDRVACDRSLPLRWRSSVTVFEYEPPADQQEIDGFLISYLKVSCSITGYQPNGREIQIRERLSRGAGWTKEDMGFIFEAKDKIGRLVNAYYPCFGAMLEVVVAPRRPDDVQFEHYPHFVDFDPKKREMYELVSETGETMSRSLDDVNVRKGQTTLESHEVKDKVSVSGSTGTGGKEGPGISATAGYESTTTDLSQRSTENVRTTDALREGRETLSHTTQMTHLYQLLSSYHVGTNRAAFFVQSRPHTNQLPSTFVNGPREIEGIQDFMLVVMRPADQENYCVEAYLETAHLHRWAIAGTGDTLVGELRLSSEDFGPLNPEPKNYPWYYKIATKSFPIPPGYEIDVNRGEGYRLESLNYNPGYNFATVYVKLEWDVKKDHLTVTATASTNQESSKRMPNIDTGPIDLVASVYLVKKGTQLFSDKLLLTARAVCSCDVIDIDDMLIDIRGLPVEDLSITYENALSPMTVGPENPLQDVNQRSVDIRHEMLRSLTSPDRYPRNTVGLLETQLVADAVGAALEATHDRTLNSTLTAWDGGASDVAERVARYAPTLTRSELLRMPLSEQVERFQISFAEAVSLRRALVDLPKPRKPEAVPDRLTVRMPRLIGKNLADAREALSEHQMVLGEVTRVDNELATGIVVAQEPLPDTTVAAGMQVALSISSGSSVVIPDIVGQPLAEGMCALLEAGVRSNPAVEGPTAPNSRIGRLQPPAGTAVTPNAAVTVFMQPSRNVRNWPWRK